MHEDQFYRFPMTGLARLEDIVGTRRAVRPGRSSKADRKARPPRAERPAFLPFSVTDLYRKIERGEFPEGMKHGRMRLWRWEDLHAYCAKLEAAGPPRAH